MKKIFFYLPILFFLSCESGEVHKYKADNKTKNFSFTAPSIFNDEIIIIKYNGDVILKYKVDSAKGYYLNREFFIPYSDNFTFSFSSSYNGKTYIDTTITANKNNFGYHLSLSRPLPINWRDYFEEGKVEPIKRWGYLPIDSCVRFVTFESDSVYMNSWTDKVN